MPGLYNDNGSINAPAAIGLLGLAKLAQGAIRQQGLRSDVSQYNQSLPSGYQIKAPTGWFNFSDPASSREALQNSYKAQAAKYDNDNQLADYNSRGASYGLAPFSNPTSAAAIISPYNTQDATHRLNGIYGPQETRAQMWAYDQYPQSPNQQQPVQQDQPQSYTQGIPVGDTGLLWDNTPPPQPTVLTGNATQTQLPDIPYGVTPEMIRNARSEKISQQNADTTSNRLQFDQQKYSEERPTRLAQLKKINGEIQATGIRNQYLSQLLRSEIARNNRSGSGKSSSQDQFDQKLAQGIRARLWTAEEAKAAQRVHMKIDPGPSSDSGTESVTTDADGNVTSITTRTKTGSGASANTGKSVTLPSGRVVKM